MSTNEEDTKANTGITFTREQRRQHALSCEYAIVCRKPIDGVYIIPSSINSSIWNGIIFVRCGIFAGSMLRFTIELPPDFPDTSLLPTVVFDLQVFHPFVFHDSRNVDFSRHFPDGWKREHHHIYHILNYLQRLFFNFDAEATVAANPEAAILYNTNKKQFRKMALETIRKSRELIYESPPGMDENAIVMTPWDQSVHEEFRKQLLKPHAKSVKKGLSWLCTDGRFMCDMYPSSGNTPNEANSIEENVEQLDLTN